MDLLRSDVRDGHEIDQLINELPYEFTNVQLVRYSADSTFPKATNKKANGNNKNNNNTKKYIIIGGKHEDDTCFYEIFFGKENNELICKPFNQLYNKKYADLKCIGLKHASFLDSFITQNNDYIIVIGHYREYSSQTYFNVYNVYDINNDEWLIDPLNMSIVGNNGNLFISQSSYYQRSLFINDQILVISYLNYIYFYDLSDLLLPKCISKYTIRSQYVYPNDQNKNYYYSKHGMCLVGYNNNGNKSEYNGNNANNNVCDLKIVLFGGFHDRKFPLFESFLEVDVMISTNNFFINSENKMEIVRIHETKHNFIKSLFSKYNDYNTYIDNNNGFRCHNSNDDNNVKWSDNVIDEFKKRKSCFDFGFECFINHKNEAIIMIIGGENDSILFDKSITLFNWHTKEIIWKDNCLSFKCDYCPATMLVSSQNNNNKKNKKNTSGSRSIVGKDGSGSKLDGIDNGDMSDSLFVAHKHRFMYFSFYTNLNWNIIRLIWIGFYKNDFNDQCYLNRLPKDIISHIIDVWLKKSFFESQN